MLAAALMVSGPWIGWWTLAPLAVAGVLFGLADRLIPSMRRPEYAVFAAWVGSELIIAASVAVSGSSGFSMLCWLAIPIVTLVARFSDRGIIAGSVIATGLLLGVAFGVDSDAVAANPPSVIAPLALILVVATFSVALMRSDAEHRSRAVLDPLTAMLNRTALEGRAQELAELSTITGEPIGMIVTDLDAFKAINDTHGHGMGDAVLRSVAYIVRKQLRAFDLAYRIGGEEFLILLPGAQKADCLVVAEQIREAIEAESSEGVQVTVSCGVGGSSRGEAFDFSAVFAACDVALYAAKRGGRNRVCVADEHQEDIWPGCTERYGRSQCASGSAPLGL